MPTLSVPVPSPPPPGVSRGPSPVVLGSQDALPVATAFTEYVHAYFRGHSPRYAVVGESIDSDRDKQDSLGPMRLGSRRNSLPVCFLTCFTTEGP